MIIDAMTIACKASYMQMLSRQLYIVLCSSSYPTIHIEMVATVAAALAAFNTKLARIGFAAHAIASINQNQVNTIASLIEMEKEDVRHKMKLA